MRKRNSCRDCGMPAKVNYLGLCDKCASDPEIVNEKLNARRITKEIRAGLPAFYESLRNQ